MVSVVGPGVVIEGYEFRELLGEGRFSTVYLVRRHKTNYNFVARVTKVNSEDLDRAWAAFDAEYQALVRLRHPNIIKLYERFRHGENFILILEHCAGGSLEGYLKSKGPMHGSRLALTVKEIVMALNYAWSCGVQHRDIRPANIMYDDNGKAKLVDFGTSITRQNLDSGGVTEFRGSRVCAAPELLLREAHDPVKSDIWAVGVTILWAAKGSVPWGAISASSLVKMVDARKYPIPDNMKEAVIDVVRKMLIVNPRDRSFPSNERVREFGAKIAIIRPGIMKSGSLTGLNKQGAKTPALMCMSPRVERKISVLKAGTGSLTPALHRNIPRRVPLPGNVPGRLSVPAKLSHAHGKLTAPLGTVFADDENTEDGG